MKRKHFLFLASLSLLLLSALIFALNVNAGDGYEVLYSVDGLEYTERGDITAFEIDSEEDFNTYAKLINGEITTVKDGNGSDVAVSTLTDLSAVLKCDISISSDNTVSFSSFAYTFDGNGHSITLKSGATNGLFVTSSGTIKGLTVCGSIVNNSGSALVSPFCQTNNGTISDCTNNVSVSVSGGSAEQYVGGFAATNNGTIQNCVNNAAMTATSGTYVDLGGIAGYIGSNGKILCCANNGNITESGTEKRRCAGIVAEANGVTGASIENCFNCGSVTSQTMAAGIISNCYGVSAITDITVKNCVNSGKITTTSANFTAGIAAQCKYAAIEYCVNTESIESKTTLAAGIVGVIQYKTSVSYCSNSGNITGTDSIGGIVGKMMSNAKGSSISNCHNSGTVLATTDSKAYCGGILGYSVVGDSGMIYVYDCTSSDTVYSPTVDSSNKATNTDNSSDSGDANKKRGIIIGCYNNKSGDNNLYAEYTQASFISKLDSIYSFCDSNGIDVITLLNVLHNTSNTGFIWGLSEGYPSLFKKSIPVIETSSKTTVYDGSTYDVSQLFSADESITQFDYSVTPLTGSGTLSGSALTITKCGDIQITLKTGETEQYFSSKATATLTVSRGNGNAAVNIKDSIYGNDYDVTVSSTTNSDAGYSIIYKQGDSVLDGKPVNAGSYTAFVTFAQNDLYNECSAEDEFTISKANPYMEATTDFQSVYGAKLSQIALSGLRANVDGTFAWETPDEIPTAGEHQVNIIFTPSDSSNYNTLTIAVTVSITKKTPQIYVKPTAGEIVYLQTLASSTLTGGESEVKGSFSWQNSSVVLDYIGSNSCNVVFTPEDTDNYTTAVFPVDVILNKANASVYTVPTAKAGKYTLLSQCEMIGGNTEQSGTFSWKDGNVILNAGGQYTAVFTPDDSIHFNSTEVTVNVTTSIIYADVNGDGAINLKDLVKLRAYLADFDSETQTSGVEISSYADCDGSGTVDTSDLIRLRKFLANYDYSDGSTTMALGVIPQ